jgi:pimeloyl-ACP methyl ester carboxylesterase
VLLKRTPKYTGPERRKAPRWKPRPIRLLLTLLGLVALIYIGVAAWLMRQETKLVIAAGSAPASGRPPFPYEAVQLQGTGGVSRPAWKMVPESPSTRRWILYLHGSATSLGSHANISRYAVVRAAGMRVLAPEYRGFGGVPGTATEATLQADARAAYEYLRTAEGVPAGDIVLYGWSLGSAVAVDLASRAPTGGVILEGAPASLVELMTRRYPFVPLRLVMRSTFDSIARIDSVGVPLLFLHSRDDQVIPLTEGRRLFEAAREPKTFVELAGGHNEAAGTDGARVTAAVAAFVRSLP